MTRLQKLIKRIPADWVIHVDSDEFLNGDYREIATLMEEEGRDYGEATMVDRLSADGKLRNLDGITDQSDLERAFPIRTAITAKLAKACSRKVCFSKWPYTGSMHSPGPHLHRKSMYRLTIDHYKWRTGLEIRLRKRVLDHRQSGLPWGVESERILMELETYGRIRLECIPPVNFLSGRLASGSIPSNGVDHKR